MAGKRKPSKAKKQEAPSDVGGFQFGGSVTGFGGRHVPHHYPQTRRSPIGAGFPRIKPMVGIRSYAKGGSAKP
jgi:hypothetical protein